MERLSKNLGGYRGETADVPALLRSLDAVAQEKNWALDRVPLQVENYAHPLNFLAFRRIVPDARLNIYISAGMHGDEPAGPLAVLQLLQEDRWPKHASIWLCPCLNPTGLLLNRRENFQGIDLNRDYRAVVSAEVRAHMDWLAQQPKFNISLCLHEDWEAAGFYVYEVNPDCRPSLAEKIVEDVSRVCPIDQGELIDDWPALKGIIRPEVQPEERPQWPEALFLIMHKTRLSYTMEAPSDFPLAGRVEALVTGVRSVLEAI